MRYNLRVLGLTVALAGAALLTPSAKADDFNKETMVTLNAPIAIEGQVLLPGEYVFKLADSAVDRDLVQIFNADETHLVTSVLGVPAQRNEPGNVTITLNEVPAGNTPSIRDWFFAGEESGIHFMNR